MKPISLIYVTASNGERCVRKCFNSFIDNLGETRFKVDGIEVTKEQGNKEFLKLKAFGTVAFFTDKVR